MKTCLFGGTFDPPHLGHLISAQTIFEAQNFDQIVFIPAYQPPHKNGHDISSIDHRFKMLKIAIKENPNFVLSDIEIKRRGLSYSIDTIRDYKNQNNIKTDDLFYLIGSDALKEFHKWKNPQSIIDEAKVIVAIRPGFRPSDIPNWILEKIQFANIPRVEISSTTIRKRWAEDKTIRYMVTESVWQYINKENLYL